MHIFVIYCFAWLKGIISQKAICQLNLIENSPFGTIQVMSVRKVSEKWSRNYNDFILSW